VEKNTFAFSALALALTPLALVTSLDICIFLFSDKKILTATTSKNPQNDYPSYAYPSTKKKDVVTTLLRDQLAFTR